MFGFKPYKFSKVCPLIVLSPASADMKSSAMTVEYEMKDKGSALGICLSEVLSPHERELVAVHPGIIARNTAKNPKSSRISPTIDQMRQCLLGISKSFVDHSLRINCKH